MSSSNDSSVTVQCGASALSEPLNMAVSALKSLLTSTQNIETNVASMYEYVKEMSNAIVHIHDSHLHGKSHSAEDKYDVESGSYSLPMPMGWGDRLIAEYNNNMDHDSNGLIYGKDFMISSSDSSRPPILDSIDTILSSKGGWSGKTISWKAYLATLPSQVRSL